MINSLLPSSQAAFPRHLLRGMLTASCLAALAACGGGGGGGSSTPQLGLVTVTVKDSFGDPVPGVTVQSANVMAHTNAQGVALVSTSSPDSTETVTLSRDSFVATSVQISSTAGRVNETVISLERATSPAGGSRATRSGVQPVVDASGQQLSFEIELIVVDAKSQPIATLALTDFTLRPCAPDASTPGNDCIGGASRVAGSGAAVDVAYAPVSAQPESLAWISGAAQVPFAAAVLLDQSGSIAATDPTGARIYSTKAFFKGLGANNQALLAAFAGAPGALITAPPLTVYAPFRDQAMASSAYFSTLDTLAPQIGGSTPLYESVDSLRQQIATPTAAAAAPPSFAKAIVVFTDGADTSCTSAENCRLSRQRTIDRARQDSVPIFTIGLSRSIDMEALGELGNQTGGAFLYAENAQQLVSLYGSVSSLAGLSQPTYRLRWTATAAASGAFRSGQSLLGHVQVRVGQNNVDVPFVVDIP